MNAVGTIVALLLLKPALIIAGGFGLVVILRRRAAAIRHAIWAGAILAAVLLPALTVILPEIRVATLAPDPTPVLAAPPVAPSTGSIRSQPGHNPLEFSPPSPKAASPITVAMLLLWGVGALVVLGRLVDAHRRLRHLIGRSRPASSPQIRVFQRARASFGITRPVSLRVSDEMASPVVAGVIRPVMLLPGEADTWPADDLAAAIAHELTHVARRDAWFNLLSGVAKGLYWCNPAVRFAIGRMRAESERACDDRVLATGMPAEAYAQLLLELARAESRIGIAADPALAMARLGELEGRLLAVLNRRIRREPVSRRRAHAFTGLALVLGLPVATLTPVPRVAALVGPEPDRQGDYLADPASERIPLDAADFRILPQARAAARGPDSALVRALIGGLDHRPGDPSDLVRDRAYWALTRARDGLLVEPLLASLSDPDWRVQAYAAWALAMARDPRALERLEPLLVHRVWRLRAMAAAAIRSIADPRSQPVMARALTDPAWQVRVEAVEYFAAQAIPAGLKRELLAPGLADRHVAVRLASAQALAP